MAHFQVKEIWRYPVKSMQGERLDQCVLGEHGIPLDRGWAVRDEARGQITGAKRLPGLLNCAARYLPGTSAGTVPHVEITLPDGTKARSDEPEVHDALSNALGAKVTLWPLQPAENKEHYRQRRAASERPIDELRRVFGLQENEPLPDLSKIPPQLLAELTEFVSPLGTYFDAYPVDLLCEASVRHLAKFAPQSDLDVRRFRPNFLIADDASLAEPAEESWIDREIQIGDASLRVELAAPRCIMTTRPQPGLPQDNAVLHAIKRDMHHCLSVYANVTKAGSVRLGDKILAN